jgi:lysyl-tRNA synthetase class 2
LGEDPKEVKKLSLGNLHDSIYKKSARKHIINPTFVMRYPASLKPLAIQNEDGTAEVAQLVVAGAEITNQYAELVDPIVQRRLLEDQAEAKAGGDAEAMDYNQDFITAMEYGMPPMTGTGIGIDRVVSIITEQPNIRDVILFPMMKPAGKKLSKNQLKKIEREEREKKIN